MSVTFPDLQTLNPDTFAVAFPACIGEKRIQCSISGEALQDHFDAGNDLVRAFSLNRSAIEAKATTLITEGRYEPDGAILIRTADFD